MPPGLYIGRLKNLNYQEFQEKFPTLLQRTQECAIANYKQILIKQFGWCTGRQIDQLQ